MKPQCLYGPGHFYTATVTRDRAWNDDRAQTGAGSAAAVADVTVARAMCGCHILTKASNK